MTRVTAAASTLAAAGLTVLLVGVAVNGFTEAETKTIRNMKQRMTRIETTHAADLATLRAEADAVAADLAALRDSVDGLTGDVDVLAANDLILSGDIETIDVGLRDLVSDDGPLAQIDRNLLMTQRIVFEAHPPIALTDISPVVACDGTSCTVDVEWTSEPPATGQVEWGLDETYGNVTTKEDALLGFHRQRIGTFPQDGTTYHFRVLADLPEGVAVDSADATATTA